MRILQRLALNRAFLKIYASVPSEPTESEAPTAFECTVFTEKCTDSTGCTSCTDTLGMFFGEIFELYAVKTFLTVEPIR